MRESKIQSVIVITLIYIASFFVGWGVFKGLQSSRMDVLWLWLWADVAATLFVWAFGLVFKNVSVYDPYWSVAPPVMLTVWACMTGACSSATCLLLIAVWVWGIRLTGNWLYTFRNLNAEDWRYSKYRASQKPIVFQTINLFGLNLMPTFVVFLAMIPGFKLIALGANANILTVIGLLVCIGSATLQLIADHQIHRYIREKRGRVCNVGLWKHGRHPNYLGEITMWWGVFLMFLSVAPAPSSDWVWGVGAVCITLLFCCISIPLMEGRQLHNKPEYAEYKKNTRMFI